MLTFTVLSPGTSGLEKTSRALPCTLDTLFDHVQAPTDDGVTRWILQADGHHGSLPLMLWAAKTSDRETLHSSASVEEAVEAATDFVERLFQGDGHAQQSVVLGFEAKTPVDARDDTSAGPASGYVVVLSVINATLLKTHSLSLRARQDLEARGLLDAFTATPAPAHLLRRLWGGGTARARRPRRNALLFLAASLLLAACLGAAGLVALVRIGPFRLERYHRPPQDNFFQAANWTAWADRNDLNAWHLRSDIGALVPSTQYDAEELPRLKWIEGEVPELARLFGNGRYPPPEDYGTVIPTGEGYHFAHCALTLRRFYWAHKRGWGLCPKDLDDEHLTHCLDVVDAHAFTVNGTAVIPTPKSTIHWFSPMVCF